MNLYSFFIKELVPRKKLIFDSSIYTYADLKSKIDLADLYLSKFKNKENILVITEDPYHLGILLLTAAKLGKTIIPLSKDLKEKQILDQISYVSPDLIIYSPVFKEIVNKKKKFQFVQKIFSKVL